MLIAEEELRYLPKYTRNAAEEDVTVFLWQHLMHTAELEDMAQIRYPQLRKANYSGMSDKRKKERISIDMLAAQLLGTKIEVTHDADNAPLLTNSDLRISISHSANVYALSISPKRHGMDIEQWSGKAIRVKHKFLQPEEETLIDSLTTQLGTKERAATLLWSAKEAAFKYIGKGTLMHNGILLSADPKGDITATFPLLDRTALIHYTLYPTCIMAYCTAPVTAAPQDRKSRQEQERPNDTNE